MRLFEPEPGYYHDAIFFSFSFKGTTTTRTTPHTTPKALFVCFCLFVFGIPISHPASSGLAFVLLMPFL